MVPSRKQNRSLRPQSRMHTHRAARSLPRLNSRQTRSSKEAQKEIERERRQTLDGVQGEIADLALAAASKLMEQKVDDQTNRELVNAFLSEEGAGE